MRLFASEHSDPVTHFLLKVLVLLMHFPHIHKIKQLALNKKGELFIVLRDLLLHDLFI